MNASLGSALSALADADRSRRTVTDAALSSWSDAAQRAFWDRVLTDLDREARRYQAAVTTLDDQLRSALHTLGD